LTGLGCFWVVQAGVSGLSTLEKGFLALRYNETTMARGWESKSVEAQQAEATEESGKTHATRLSPEEAAEARRKENLLLARRRVAQQLESTQSERHRKLLQEALAALDEKLGAFHR